MAGGPWFGVSGDRVVGPFHNLQHAKQALNIPVNIHNDERVVPNGLYRYGTAFVGVEQELVRRNMMKAVSLHSSARVATHYRTIFGREVRGTIQTLRTTEWLSIK